MSRNSESKFQVHLSSTKAMVQYMTLGNDNIFLECLQLYSEVVVHPKFYGILECLQPYNEVVVHLNFYGILECLQPYNEVVVYLKFYGIELFEVDVKPVTQKWQSGASVVETTSVTSRVLIYWRAADGGAH